VRAFVTGIAGFVGSYLAEALIARRVEVHGLVIPGGPLDNLDEIRGTAMPSGALRLYEADLGDLEGLVKLIEEVRPEQVYHLAAASSVRRSQENPGETFQVNVMGTWNLLEATRRAGVSPRILLVSSAEAYGESARLPRPTREEDALLPLTPYGASKAATELIATKYVESFGLDIVRVRPFPHTGPRHAAHFVFPDFAKQVAEIDAGLREPILHTGSLDVRRDITDVRDMVQAYWLALTGGERGGVYNLCSGMVYSLREVAQLLCSMISKPIRIATQAERLRPHDLAVLAGSNQRFRDRSGWTAAIPLARTLGDLVGYWKGRLGMSTGPLRDDALGQNSRS
jgi:GDP-4-dehydro-6-deoxy-D-mannose reductase